MKVMATPATTNSKKKTHPKTEEALVDARFVRIEPAAAQVNRCGASIREAVRLGQIPAIRDGRKVLVDLDAVLKRFAPTPITPEFARGQA